MHAPLVTSWLMACTPTGGPPSAALESARVEWVRGDEEQLTIGVRGPATEVWLEGPGGERTVAVDGEQITVGPLSEGTWTVRASADDPGMQQRVGSRLERISHEPLATAADVKGDAGRLVVAGGARNGAVTATVLDISDPTSPVVLWVFEGLGLCRDAALDGRYLYVAVECGCAGNPDLRDAWDEIGLRIIDLDAPGGPAVVGELGVPEIGGIHNLTVHGDLLYLADNHYDAVQVVDVSDPTTPVVRSSWSPAQGIVHDQTLQEHPDGSRLLVATWKGLGVLDLTDPAAPTQRLDAPLEIPAAHQAWPLDHEHVLMTSEIASGHLTVWRLPEADEAAVPVLVGEANPFPSGMIHNVTALGGRAYGAWYRDGLVALDVTDPSQPWVIGVQDTSELGPEPAPADGPFVGAWGVWVDPDSPEHGVHLVAVSDSHAGLQLFYAWPEVMWYPRDDSNVRPTD